jgi:WD40 repeat protein
VAGATDGHIRWWKKTDSGEFQRAAFITAHSDVVSGIATSTDGRLLATVSLDGAMRLWDASSGSEAFTTEILGGRPRALTWSPDGRWLASPLTGHDESGSLVLWDGTTGKLLARLTGHAKAAKSVAFSPDGQWCATGAEDGSLIVWNAKNGVRVRSMDHAGHPVTSVTFSRDSSMLASGAGDGTVRIWELAADSSIPKQTWRHPVLVSSVVFDRDHRSVITGAIDGQIIRWKLNATSAGQLLARVDSSISVLQLSPDGSLLASLTDAGHVRIVDTTTFEPRCVLSTVQLEDACFAFSPDGRFIALRDNEYGVKVCEIATGATMGRLWGHTDLVSGLAFSPDGATLAVASWSGRVKVWNTSDLSLAVSGPSPAGQAVPAAVPPLDRQSPGYDRVNHRGAPTLWSLPPTTDLLSFFRSGAAKESAGTLQWLPQPEDAVPRDFPPHGLPTAEWRLLGDSTVSPEQAFSFKMKVLARGDQWQAAMALWKQFHAVHQGVEVPEEVRSVYLTLLLTTQRAQGAKLDPATRSLLADAIDAAAPDRSQFPFPPEWLRSTPAE